MTPTLQWILISTGVLIVLFAVVFLISWIAHRRDMKELRSVEANLSVLDRTSKVFNGLTDTLKERRRVLQNMSKHLSAQRLELQKEIDALEHRRAQINIAIERADINELERLIEGK
jgi:hypothetical protein